MRPASPKGPPVKLAGCSSIPGRSLVAEDVVHRLADELVERAVLVDHDDYLVFAPAFRRQASRLQIALEAAQAPPAAGLRSARSHDRLPVHDGYLLRLICRAHLVIQDRLAPRPARPTPRGRRTTAQGDGPETAGLADYVNLWAGQAYPLTSTAPAADLVRDLWEQAREALRRTASHVPWP